MSNCREAKRKTIGDDKTFHGKAIVAFIDILGFSKFIEKNWDDKDNDPIKLILSLKEKIIHNVPEIPFMLLQEEKPYDYFFDVKCRVFTISDCFIISHPIKDSIEHSEFLAIYSVTLNILLIWRMLIMKGFTIRGAISYGNIFWNELEIIGQAYMNAYRNEENNAKISRVIVSSDCNQIVKKLLIKYEKGMKNLFIKDIDGYTIINPKHLIEDNLLIETVIEKLTQMQQLASSALIKEKYTGLLNHIKNNQKSDLIDY